MSPTGSGLLETAFTRQLGIEVPIICGAMYPCTNPELVAAVSEAGGIGIIQPISLTYVYRHDFRAGVRRIRNLTSKPIGMNVLIEKSSKSYQAKMTRWLDIALEEGVHFIITSLGKPDWVVKRVHAAGGLVYHDVTERKWAEKGIDSGVDGLIAVNNRAGGHAGTLSAQELYTALAGYKLPLICAGGIGSEQGFVAALRLGYAGVQMGTRFIATRECGAGEAYKHAIVAAQEQDIVLSERITGVPVAVIATPTVRRLGLKAGFLARWLLRGSKTRHLMRALYTLRSLWQLKRASLDSSGDNDYWQAGKSVAGIQAIEPAGEIIRRYAAAVRQA